MCCHVLYGEHAPSPMKVSWTLNVTINEEIQKKSLLEEDLQLPKPQSKYQAST